MQSFANPQLVDADTRVFRNFGKLDVDGLVFEGEVVMPEDIIIGKVAPYIADNKLKYKDISQIYNGIT